MKESKIIALLEKLAISGAFAFPRELTKSAGILLDFIPYILHLEVFLLYVLQHLAAEPDQLSVS